MSGPEAPGHTPAQLPPGSAGCAPRQPELAWAYSSDRKRLRRLKRAVARAERVRREGFGPCKVDCPHCGAPAFVSLKRQYDCRSGNGPYRVRFKHHSGYHKARVEAAKTFRSRILADGESAAAELALAKTAMP